MIVSLAAFATACADDEPKSVPPPVVIDAAYDTTVDFSEYESFDVVGLEAFDDGLPPPGYTARNRREVENAIINELSDHGLVYDDVSPDLRVAPFVRLTETEVVDETWWWDSYWGWYWGYAYARPWYEIDVIEFETGTLIVDVVDLGDAEDESDDTLVFRGTATALFWTYADHQPRRIATAVDGIFDYWPDEDEST